jgi:phage shock protein E
MLLFGGCGTKPNTHKENKQVEQPLLLIDVRSKEEFASEHLNRSIHIPHEQIGQEIEKFAKDKNTKIVLFCRSGARASIALQTLNQMGYLNVTNIGGFSTAKEKYPD